MRRAPPMTIVEADAKTIPKVARRYLAPELVNKREGLIDDVVARLRRRSTAFRRASYAFLGAVVVTILAGTVFYVLAPLLIRIDQAQQVAAALTLDAMVSTNDAAIVRNDQEFLNFKSTTTHNFYISGLSSERLLPDNTAPRLISIRMLTDSVGWAAGEGGVFHTIDGGRAWTPVEISGIEGGDFRSILFLDSRVGWAVTGGLSSNANSLFYTENGGASWIKTELVSLDSRSIGQLLVDNSLFGPVDIVFSTRLLGWIIGQSVFKTTDGGLNWSLDPSMGKDLSSMYFYDANTGWALSVSGAVSRTVDSGLNWAEIGQLPNFVGNKYAVSMHFLDQNNGWVSASDPDPNSRSFLIFRTTDGGANWELLSELANIQSSVFSSIYFRDSMNGLVSTNSNVFQTTDGGASWLPILTGDGISRFSVLGSSIWVAGGRTIESSNDGGLRWQTALPGTNNNFTSIDFVSESTGWAAGSGGSIRRTIDAGQTWTSLHSGSENLNDIVLVDLQHGWAVGSRGTILGTDGGVNWYRQVSTTDRDLYAITAVDVDWAWAVGAGGLVLRTVDGGTTWEQQDTGLASDLLGVVFLDRMNGWVVGATGAILTTRDGGNEWIAQQSQTDRVLRAVWFVDMSHGWAAGDGGTLQSTIDGGATWDSGGTGTTIDLLDVAFIDARIGWVAGRGGRVLATGDGGSSWAPLPTTLPTSFGDAMDLDFVGHQFGWVAGANGGVFSIHAPNPSPLAASGRKNIREAIAAAAVASPSFSPTAYLADLAEIEQGYLQLSNLREQFHDLEATTDNDLSPIVGGEFDYTTFSTRVGVVLLLLFLVGTFSTLYRYSQKMAAFSDSRADSLSLLKASSIEVDFSKLATILSPDGIGFAKGRSPTDQAFEAVRDLLKPSSRE